MSHLVGDTVALIERYGAPVHLVGHDWGSAVAWATAGAHPELVRTLTTVSVPHPTAFGRSLLTSSQALRVQRAGDVLPVRGPLGEAVQEHDPRSVERPAVQHVEGEVLVGEGADAASGAGLPGLGHALSYPIGSTGRPTLR
jgi:pimeloyl-ACP methyl ester carboxylesterase